MYGAASIFASGLIVDGLHAFQGDLWKACTSVMGAGKELSQHGSHDLLKRDWVRRAEQFAHNYFADQTLHMTDCLKDCHLLHKWETVAREIQPINFTKELGEQAYTEVDTMGAQACAGGSCEI